MKVLVRSKIHSLLFGLLICISGCGGGEEDSTPVTSGTVRSGAIGSDEIESAPPITSDDLVTAFERATTMNPSLLSDDIALKRIIFEDIKTRATPKSSEHSAMRLNYWTVYAKLNPAERRVVWQEIPIVDSYKNYKAKNLAEQEVVNTFISCNPTESFEDTKADAVRHAYWNALMTKSTSLNSAEKLASAHEFGTSKPSASSMDLSNNKVGRYIAEKYKNATDEELLNIIVSLKFSYIPAGVVLPVQQDVLVYTSTQDRFDGQFVGTFTNPDSGAEPWVARFDVNQCGTILRGQISINRAQSMQVRRFTGSLRVGGAIDIIIADPYSFEMPPNLVYCTGMTARLEGTNTRLDGNWASTNCRQGGVIALSR